MADQSCPLYIFELGIVGPNSTYSDQLYANGNQQLSVYVNVLKQDSVSGQQIPLSQAEKDSLTIVQYSSSSDASLPAGWACETTKNQFDQGLRGASLAAAAPAKTLSDVSVRDSSETFTLYLKAGTSVVAVQSYQFMARIKLDDGQICTTHSTLFESKITVSPQLPYVIQVSELVERQENTYSYEYNKNEYVDVDVYYWTLPSSLYIAAESFSGQGASGSKLWYAWVKNSDPLHVGAAIGFQVTSLTLGDIGNLPSSISGSTNISLINDNHMLRALRYLCDDKNASTTYDNNMHWDITDNLGCVSKFVLTKDSGDDSGNLLELVQG